MICKSRALRIVGQGSFLVVLMVATTLGKRAWIDGKGSVLPAEAVRMEGTLPNDVMMQGARKGRHDARAVLVEFTDYECPFCAQSANELLPQIERQFVDNGGIEYILVNYPIERIHPRALKAAEAAECAKPHGRYWNLHDRLFAGRPVLDDDALVRYAVDAGLNDKAFRACLDGQFTDKIRKDRELGRSMGVVSTPTFVIGRRGDGGTVDLRWKIVGAVPYNVLERAINETLK